MKKFLTLLATLALFTGPAAGTIVKHHVKFAPNDIAIDRLVSNNTIAGGYGAGVDIHLNPMLDGSDGYWTEITGTNDKLKLYDEKGKEAAWKIEYVGSQLAMNRNDGINYRGYIFDLQAGFTFNAEGALKTFPTSKTLIAKSNEHTYVWDEFIAPTSLAAPADKELMVGDAAVVLEANLVTTDTSPVIIWESSDETVAKIINGNELLPISEGTAVVTVYSGLLKATMNVTVTPSDVPVSGISITTPDKTITTYEGNNYDLSLLTANYMHGTNTGAPVLIDASMISGAFDKNVLGNYTLTLTAGGFSDTFTVKVIELPIIDLGGLVVGNDFGNNSGWGHFYVKTSAADIGQYLNVQGDALAELNQKVLVNGETGKISSVKNLGGGRYEFWFNNGGNFVNGDKVKVLQGMPLIRYSGTADGNHDPNGDGEFIKVAKLDKDYEFVWGPKDNGNNWRVFVADPSDFTLTASSTFLSVGEGLQLEYEMIPAGTFGTPKFTSNNTAVATVDAKGLVAGVSEGSVKITAELHGVSKSVNLQILAAKPIKSIEIVETPNYYSVVKDSNAADFKPALKKARIVFNDDTFSPDFEITDADYRLDVLDTSVVGDKDLKVFVTYEAVEYETTIKVNVYEYYDQKVKEVAVVDWFIYSTFIQFTNTSTNVGNITSSPLLSEMKEKISYHRKDGTEVAIQGVYQLNENVAIFPSFLYDAGGNAQLTAENYDQFYLEGDIITLKQNMPVFKWTGDLANTGSDNGALKEGTGEIIIEGFVTEETQYKYVNQTWVLWVEFTDIALANDTVNLEVGQTQTVGATRVPGHATQGQFSYVSSDPSVATVSSTGIIKGVKPGTATITVTLSDVDNPTNTKTGTVTVNVTDPIKSIVFDEPIEVKLGTESLDLSKVVGHFKHASGTIGAEVDLTNATVEGYDPHTLGSQKVNISVVVDGKTITGTLDVDVVKGGLTGLAIGLIIGGSAVVLAGVGVGIFFLLKKKKA